MKTPYIFFYATMAALVALSIADEKYVSNDCDLEPDTGPCKARLSMYYYNVSEGKCRTFVYGGCETMNKNRFFTEEQCLEACSRQPATTMSASTILPPVLVTEQVKEVVPIIPVIPTTKPTTVDVCKLEPDSGVCKGHFVKYFFNALSGTCDSFVYGGCFGNDNRFDSMRECHNVCKPEEQITKTYLPRTGFEHCFLPKMSGNCKGNFQRYFYNPDKKECETFKHGGCEGNRNNFESETECLKSCANSEMMPPTKVLSFFNAHPLLPMLNQRH